MGCLGSIFKLCANMILILCVVVGCVAAYISHVATSNQYAQEAVSHGYGEVDDSNEFIWHDKKTQIKIEDEYNIWYNQMMGIRNRISQHQKKMNMYMEVDDMENYNKTREILKQLRKQIVTLNNERYG